MRVLGICLDVISAASVWWDVRKLAAHQGLKSNWLALQSAVAWQLAGNEVMPDTCSSLRRFAK